MEGALRSSAAAIEELRSSLEEESLSPIVVDGSIARFTVQGEDGTAYSFTATFEGSAPPCPAHLACTSGNARGLAKANGKLATRSTLTRAVAAAGRCVAVDLDWVVEAEEGEGGRDGWAGGRALWCLLQTLLLSTSRLGSSMGRMHSAARARLA